MMAESTGLHATVETAKSRDALTRLTGENNNGPALTGGLSNMDTSRVSDPSDNSVRPSRDTGFRMAPQPPFSYTPRPVPQDPHLFIDYVHNDDMKDVGQGTLRGQPLDSVRVYNIDYDATEERIISLILENIAMSN